MNIQYRNYPGFIGLLYVVDIHPTVYTCIPKNEKDQFSIIHVTGASTVTSGFNNGLTINANFSAFAIA